MEKNFDSDPLETKEWLDSFNSVIESEGGERAHFLLKLLLEQGRKRGFVDASSKNTPYCNTIPVEAQAPMPGDPILEQRIRSLVRWNAMMMVIRAQSDSKELGGHIGSFASSASLYDVGLNHFWRSGDETQSGDLVYFQGHTSPGMYARSYLLGDLSEEQLNNFRQEVDGKGLSSYPHPWLMPNYWQFATVSMGLGPLQAIYQARFMKYLEARGLIEASKRKVWCFCGDGEMDEPESLGAITLASREKLDNLIFVINCNLQRLDGPVRGNGKIIQELEANFKGAGWEVIKLIWGAEWDRLFERDKTGILLQRMEEAVDGDYQNYKAHGGAYTRENFFGKYEELRALVADMSDDDILRMKRGGHDSAKVYAAYHHAVHDARGPVVILAKTVKGYGLGSAGEAKNTAHNTKKMSTDDLITFKNRFSLPIPDEKVAELPFYKPADDSAEMKYLKARRAALGGTFPKRRLQATQPLRIPPLSVFNALLEGSGDRKFSTTMAYVRILTTLVKDKELGPYIVPIVADEARTFGMEGLFRQLGIYAPFGQLYQPVDAEELMFYKEAKNGQILQEGINEAGSFCSWLAAATSYSNHNRTMVPFYVYYSMFGHQRIGDLAWASGDMRAKGFLIGATSGRTTLNGEGLQHQDGHSHLLAGTIPTCRSYDPTFAFELAVIIHDGLVKMYVDDEDVQYYITTMNENYAHPAMPAGAQEGILRGMYCLRPSTVVSKHTVQLLGSGTILNEVLAAAEMLEQDFQIKADVWSVTSFNELRRDGLNVARHNLLHPTKKPEVAYVAQCLGPTKGPIVATTDYMKLYADQIRAFIPGSYTVLGTDGFGRSDTREALREFFEVNRYWIAYAAMKALFDEGEIDAALLAKVMKKYHIDANKPNPVSK